MIRKNSSLFLKILICLLHFEAHFPLIYWFPPHLHHRDYNLCLRLFEVYQSNIFFIAKEKYIAKPKHTVNSDEVSFKFGAVFQLAKKTTFPSKFNTYQPKRNIQQSKSLFTSHIKTMQNGFLITKP